MISNVVYSKPKTQPTMVKKDKRVDVKNSTSTLDPMKTSVRTANGVKIQALSPPVGKILIGLCISQMVMLVVSSATLGAFVNSNTHEIDSLVRTTENMQAKINQLESQVDSITSLSHSLNTDTSWEELRSGITDLQAKHQADVLEISNDLAELHGIYLDLKNKTEEHGNATKSYGARILQLEAGHVNFNDTITSIGIKTAQLEIAREIDQENAQTLNSTIAQLELDVAANGNRFNITHMKVDQLAREQTIDRNSIKKLNESIVELELEGTLSATFLENLNVSINNVESDTIENRADIQALQDNIATLGENGALDRAMIRELNASVEQLQADFGRQTILMTNQNLTISQLKYDVETNNDLIRNTSYVITALNASVEQLKSDFRWQTILMNNQNLTISQLKDDVETNKDLIRNNSNALSAISAERQTDIAAIEANSEKLFQLRNDFNTTNDLYYNLELRLSYIEDALNCTWRNWTVFSDCPSGELQYRERVCESKNPSVDGQWGSRKDFEFQSCQAVDGGWGDWSSYSACSQTCDGIETRERVCDNPSPTYGGEACSGISTETRLCNTNICGTTTYNGFTIGETVCRGPDWKWGFQDSNGPGTVLDFDCDPGWVKVTWTADGSTNVYRVGAEGAMDLVHC